MRQIVFVTAIAAFAAVTGNSQPASAAGCLSGAAVGAVAGHVAGHHAVLGAGAGCAVGHHEANKATPAATQNAAPPANGGPTTTGATQR